MADILIPQLKQEMKRQGFNAKSLSLAAGLGETSVRDILTGRARNPRRDTLQKIARTLGRPLSFFLPEEPVPMVPVVGTIGHDKVLPARAGPAVLDSAIKGGLREPSGDSIRYHLVEAPPEPGYRDLAAIRVTGDALAPFLPPGSIVYYSDAGLDAIEECIGRLCVVHLKDGTALLRTLRRGTLYGCHTLEGFSGPALENVEIARCAKVLFIKQA